MSPVLPASARSDSSGTVLPLSASVLCSELSDREEAVHSAGHTAAEPSPFQAPVTYGQIGVINMSMDRLWILCPLFFTQTQTVRRQNHRIAAL